jgi:hypothetical protein
MLNGGRCVCSGNADGLGKIVEHDVQGALLLSSNGSFLQRCIICSANTDENSAWQRCGSCEFPKVLAPDGECKCPAAVPDGVRCSDSDPLQRILDHLRISSGGNPYAGTLAPNRGGEAAVMTSSYALVNNLADAAQGCHDVGDTKACNALGNLCVLQRYRKYGCPACRVRESV